MHRIALSLLLAFGVALAAHAQDGRDLSDDARTRYAKALKEAATLVQQRRFDAARRALDALVAERPREPQARFLIGVVQTESGDDTAATKTFLELTQEFPELPEPHNNLAVLHAKRGDLESARIELETAIKAAPEWGVAHENLGDIHARIAADHYERAVKIDRLNKTAAAKLTLARSLLSGAASTASPTAAEASATPAAK